MSQAFISGSEINSDNIKEVDSKELEAFNKLLSLEEDLIKLKMLLVEVRKIKECCSYTNELQEINASRKK